MSCGLDVGLSPVEAFVPLLTGTEIRFEPFAPLVPSSPTPAWVTVWVKHKSFSAMENQAHIFKKILLRVPLCARWYLTIYASIQRCLSHHKLLIDHGGFNDGFGEHKGLGTC